MDTTADQRSPGRSFADALTRGDGGARGLTDPLGRSEAVYFEAETARAVRTHTHRYTRHIDDYAPAELFDLVADPDQRINVAGDARYADIEQDLAERIDLFWATYRDERYDLWTGGTGQAMLSRYVTFAQRNGPGWNITTDVGPPFAY